jgi:uncharacterized protein YjbJ (UPF0337 family)
MKAFVGLKLTEANDRSTYVSLHVSHVDNAVSLKENVMDKNRVEGAAKQVTGSVKEAIGKVTGNKTTQAEGAAEKVAGKVQSKVGEAADAVRDKFKK